MPAHPSDLLRHECLTLSSDASQTRGWAFLVDGELTHLRPRGRLDCSDGQVLHDWCLRGMGIAWRSTWEVEREVAEGQLVALLEDFDAPPNGIYAVFPQRKHLPLRVRLWIDHLKHSYGDPAYWKSGAPRRLKPVQPPASVTHFLVKLVRAAPASFFSSACLSHAAAAEALLPPSFSHLVTKLVLAAPASFFSAAIASQLLAPPASASHFFMKLVSAAPASFFSLAVASHAALAAKAGVEKAATARVRMLIRVFIVAPRVACRMATSAPPLPIEP